MYATGSIFFILRQAEHIKNMNKRGKKKHSTLKAIKKFYILYKLIIDFNQIIVIYQHYFNSSYFPKYV